MSRWKISAPTRTRPSRPMGGGWCSRPITAARATFIWWIGRRRLAASLRRRLGLAALLLLACAAPQLVATRPQPVLHPNLADALSGGFTLLVGQAPFEARLWIENSSGYQAAWALGGAEPVAAGQAGKVVA